MRFQSSVENYLVYPVTDFSLLGISQLVNACRISKKFEMVWQPMKQVSREGFCSLVGRLFQKAER